MSRPWPPSRAEPARAVASHPPARCDDPDSIGRLPAGPPSHELQWNDNPDRAVTVLHWQRRRRCGPRGPQRTAWTNRDSADRGDRLDRHLDRRIRPGASRALLLAVEDLSGHAGDSRAAVPARNPGRDRSGRFWPRLLPADDRHYDQAGQRHSRRAHQDRRISPLNQSHPADGKALKRLSRSAAGRAFALTVRHQVVAAPAWTPDAEAVREQHRRCTKGTY
ncbi:MAG: hypothetical protein JWL97_4022 [Gemmatimonadales bacterium]|jgi:hypothetical protein|nr:hypothetical protein [Gemmatimonadales bacterium]